MTTVEIDLAGNSLIHFRREAMRRNLPVARLVHNPSTRSRLPGATFPSSSSAD